MRRATLLMAALGLVLLANLPVSAGERARDDVPRIAVMSAHAPEWEALLAATQERQDHVLNGRRFVTGILGGQKVLLVLSGISMINAAMTAQQTLDRFNIRAIVFSGIAGGVDPALSIGDVVVADQWGEYLESVFAREKDGRFVPPDFAFIRQPFPNFGMMVPIETEVTREGRAEPESRFWFPADAKLLDVARSLSGSVTLENCATPGICLAHRPRIVIGGNGVSGQAFVDNAKFRDYVFATFRAEVLDMESAAVAHVAYANAVPFIAFRSLSDLAGGGEGENQLGTFFALAATNSAKVVIAFLAALSNADGSLSSPGQGR